MVSPSVLICLIDTLTGFHYGFLLVNRFLLRFLLRFLHLVSLEDVFISLSINPSIMRRPKKSEEEQKEISPFGGLEDLTIEEIDKNIRDYPYVLSKLKDC